ncbi:MAG: hypothetical protein IKR71_09635 [Bacteroidales bacterium]|nr:hypothetical protein [Bacteroidales bacterium]
MKQGDVIRFVCILLLWVFLCWLVLTRAKLTLMTLFSIVASGIIVFVPLYKKYYKHRND